MRVVSRTAPLAAAALLALLSTSAVAQHRFNETDLVSDISGRAQRTDPNLVNPWGIVPGPTGVFWVSDEATGVSTLYQPDGTIVPLVVTIPGGGPTGIVVTSAQDSIFEIPSADTVARAVFIFATSHGTIAAWSPTVNQTNAIEVASTSEAVYLGLAIGISNSGPRLYAADFR